MRWPRSFTRSRFAIIDASLPSDRVFWSARMLEALLEYPVKKSNK